MDRATVKTRRTHRKSKGGCQACKQRRIKCDEVKPCCGSCLKHSKPCSFNDDIKPNFSTTNLTGAISLSARIILQWSRDQENGTPISATPTSPDKLAPPGTHGNGVSLADIPFDVSLSDLQLMHHYMASVSRTFGGTEDNLRFWQQEVPDIGFQYHSILRLMLALAAYHRATVEFDGHAAFSQQGDELFNAGVKAQAAVVASIEKASLPAVFLGGVLISLCSFAAGPRPGDYLLFSTTDKPSSMTGLLHGLRVILNHAGDVRAHELISQSATMMSEQHAKIVQDANDQREPLPHIHAFRHLRTFFAYPSLAHREKEATVYAETIDRLEEIFSIIVSKATPYNTEGLGIQYGHVLGSFFYRMSDDFSVLLERRQPPALIIFAYCAALMKYHDSLWIFKGWPEHIMAGVYSNLPPVDRSWLQWPTEQIRWTPT